MKKLCLLLIFVFLGGVVWGQAVWNGSANGDWYDTANWDGGIVYGTGDLTIDTDTNVPSTNIPEPLNVNGNLIISGSGTFELPGGLNVTGTADLGASITTNGTRSTSANGILTGQDYRGPVTISDDVTLTANGTTPGTTLAVRFRGAVNDDAAGRELRITGTAWIGAAIGGTNRPALIEVTGPTRMANATINTNGNQIYDGPVTLEANVTLNASTATPNLVRFTGTVDSNNNTTNRTLAINNANVEFLGEVGLVQTPAMVTSINVNNNGSTTINANIRTSGVQNYTGDVILGGTGTRILTSTGGSVAADGAVTAAVGITGLTVNASHGITLNNAGNTIGGTVTLDNNQTGSTPQNAISFTTTSTATLTVSGINHAAVGTAPGNFTIITGGELVIGTAGIDAIGTIVLTSAGEITQTGHIIGNGTLNLNSGTAAINLLTASNSVSEVGVTASTGFIFHNSHALTVDAVSATVAGNVEIYNTNTINVDGVITAGTLMLDANNTTSAANNNITIGAAPLVATKIHIISGRAHGAPGSAEDRCGTVNINSNIVITGAASTDTITIEASQINNSNAISVSNGNAALLLDNATSALGISVNATSSISIGTRHTAPVDLIYYTTSSTGTGLPANAMRISSEALPGNFEFSGYRNVYLANVEDDLNRTVTIDAITGFVEFHNLYTYEGTNANHLHLPATGTIQSYNATIDMGASNFSSSLPIHITQGSLSITTANVITLDGGVTGTTGQANNLTLISTKTASPQIDIGGALGSTVTHLGVVTIEAGHIAIGSSSPVWAGRLVLKATSATGEIDITDAEIHVTAAGREGEAGATAAAMYVYAEKFTGGGGEVNISNTTGEICAWVGEFDFDLTINGGHGIHFHILNRHIVYADENPGITFVTSDNGPFFFIDADSPLIGDDPEFSAPAGKNIYILAVEAASYNSKSPVLKNTLPSATDDFIEFRGEYTSSGSITLSPGSGGVRLDGAEIDLKDTGDFTVEGDLLLVTSSEQIINVDDITIDGNISATAANHDLVLKSTGSNGDVYITGTVGETNPLNDITIETTHGHINIHDAITAAELNAKAGKDISLVSVENSVPIVNLEKTGTGSGAIVYNSDHAAGITITAISHAAAGGTIAITEETGDIILGTTGNNTISTGTHLGEITIEAVTGSITVAGDIDSSGNGDVTLKSGTGENITIDGTINCYGLSLIAGDKDNDPDSIVTIIGSITVTSQGQPDNHDEESAVFINAGEIHGNGPIHLPPAPLEGWVCAYIYSVANYEGAVTTDSNGIPRIHYHTSPGRHIVYTTETDDDVAIIIDIPKTDFLYLDAASNIGSSINYYTSIGGNVYIVNIPENAVQPAYENTRNVIFGSLGFIEIIGDYYSSGSLKLVIDPPGTNIQLNDANITLTAYPFEADGSILLTGDSSSITAAGITLAGVEGTAGKDNNLTLTSTQDITVSGTMGDTTVRLGNIIVTNAAAAVFNGDISAASFRQDAGTVSTTFNGEQNYTGSFGFTGALALVHNNITANSGINFSGPLEITSSALTTVNSNISFGNTVQVAAAATVNSGAGVGNIAFASTVGGAGNLTMAAGTGDISITGAIGTLNPLAQFGNIHINSASDVQFSADVTAAGFEQDAGTGTTAFLGAQNYSGNFAFNGNALTVSSTLTAGGSVTVNNSGAYNQIESVSAANFTQTLAGSVQLSGNITVSGVPAANAFISFNSLVTLTVPVTFSAPPSGGSIALAQGLTGASLTLNGGSTEAAPLSLTRSSSMDSILITRGSYVSVGSGIAAAQTNGSTLTLEEGNGTLNGAILNVSAGSWHIGTSATSGDFAGADGSLVLGGHAAHTARDTQGARLISNALNLSGTFIVSNTNSGWAYISASGNANISSGVVLQNLGSYEFSRLIIEMTGMGSLTAARPLGSLHVNSAVTLLTGLEVYGEVVFNGSGTLDATGRNVTMYAGIIDGAVRTSGRWENNTSSADTFTQSHNDSIEFKRVAPDSSAAPLPIYFEILGNTTWDGNFICREPGAIIQFSTHPHQHIFHREFRIEGEDGADRNDTRRNVTLTRYPKPPSMASWNNRDVPAVWVYDYDRITTPPSRPSGTLAPGLNTSHPIGLPLIPISRDLKKDPDTEQEKFWNFNLDLHSADGARHLYIENVTIYYSHAYDRRIPIDQDSMKLRVIPYYRDNMVGVGRIGYFNYDWIQVRKIIYSFIEDSNGNGKEDRIRVQTNIPLNGNFSEFEVEVEGYGKYKDAVDFKVVYDVLDDPDVEDENSFYIYLKEKPYLYGGHQIKWWITKNNSLADRVTGELPVGDPYDETGEFYLTVNTIPPRISYALTLPGHPETYIRMSQPVTGLTGTIGGDKITTPYPHIDVAYDKEKEYFETIEYYPFDLPPVPYEIKIPEGVLGYKVPLNSANSTPDIVDLAGLPPVRTAPSEWYFYMLGLESTSVPSLDWNDEVVDADSYMYYPSPRYPVDWNYTKYMTYKGNSYINQGGKYNLTEDDLVNNPVKNVQIFYPPYRLLTPEMTKRLEDYAAGVSGTSTVKPDEFDLLSAVDTELYRRITDVLVSIAPSVDDGSSPNYFAWPVWARYKDETMHKGLDPDSSLFGGRTDTDDGIIWQFDGTGFLENRDINLQARINSRLESEGFNRLKLFFGFNVPAEWRNPAEAGVRGRRSGGLWLPYTSDALTNALFNIVPSESLNANGSLGFYNRAVPVESEVSASLPPLFNFYLLNEDGNKFSSGGKLDFLLRLEDGADPNLFIARLDAPAGANIDNIKWWTMIRPFSFDIQNIRSQRGGVTILNNVINSDKRENAYIRYHLVRSGRVTIQVYTLDGTLVKSIRRNEQREAGEYTDPWDGSNNGGRAVARGMYFIRVVGPDIDEIRKVMVVK